MVSLSLKTGEMLIYVRKMVGTSWVPEKLLSGLRDTRTRMEIIKDEVTDTLESDPIHGRHPNMTVPVLVLATD